VRRNHAATATTKTVSHLVTSPLFFSYHVLVSFLLLHLYLGMDEPSLNYSIDTFMHAKAPGVDFVKYLPRPIPNRLLLFLIYLIRTRATIVTMKATLKILFFGHLFQQRTTTTIMSSSKCECQRLLWIFAAFATPYCGECVILYYFEH
jgi:hypothetical protein